TILWPGASVYMISPWWLKITGALDLGSQLMLGWWHQASDAGPLYLSPEWLPPRGAAGESILPTCRDRLCGGSHAGCGRHTSTNNRVVVHAVLSKSPRHCERQRTARQYH